MSNEAQAAQATHYCALSIHNEDYPEGSVVFDPDSLQLKQGGLYLLMPRKSNSSIQDFQQRPSSVSATLSTKDNDNGKSSLRKRPGGSKKSAKVSAVESHADFSKSMVFVAQPLSANGEQKRKVRGMQVSIFRQRLIYDYQH